jgi:hypothetical protein
MSLPKLPRVLYWGIGAAIACGGALVARVVSERVPSEYEVAVWLAGGAAVFLGVAVLSLGTRYRLEPNHEDADAGK